MWNMRPIFHLFIIISAFALINCNDPKATEPEGFNGTYVAVKFIFMANSDGDNDVLATGGALTAVFSADNKVNGYLLITKESQSVFGPANKNYSGEYKIRADTVWFNNTGTFLDNPIVYFFVKENKLESRNFTGRLASTKIVFMKQ
jgi:hypothetical protein